MNILFLYGNNKALRLAEWLEKQGNIVYRVSIDIDSEFIKQKSIELIVSFTYRHYISNKIVNMVNGNAVNLHISYLPWNKGADPNIWSWIDATPKGVSIHYVSHEIDGGDLIAQKKVNILEQIDTLESSYNLLMDEVINLFQEIYPRYNDWRNMKKPQECVGTKHYSSELADIKENIDYGISVHDFIKAYRNIVRRKRVVFRVDGNDKIGIGHVMRCLSLADALNDEHMDVLFVLSDHTVSDYIRKRGYDSFVLNSAWDNYLSGIEQLLSLLDCWGCDWIITDSYYAQEKYFIKIKEKCKSAIITEEIPEDSTAPVDLLINYNLYMNDVQHNQASGFCCLGSKYALLRKSFSKTYSGNGEYILVLSGGSDPMNVVYKIVKRLVEDKRVTRDILVVSGSLNPNLSILQELSNNVSIMIDVTDMAFVMSNARVAISAGGSTLYELAACGVPTITYSFVDNQIKNVKAFAANEIMPYAGDFRKDEQNVLRNIIQKYIEYEIGEEIREKTIVQLRRLCDGLGASRVANVIKRWEE